MKKFANYRFQQLNFRTVSFIYEETHKV